MIVELDIFSGLRNPSWELSTDQTFEFIEKISQNKIIQNLSENSKPDLGYRGFIIEEKPNDSQKTRKFTVYGKIIKVYENSSVYLVEDQEHGIERWLFQTAINKVDDDILNCALQEFENKIK